MSLIDADAMEADAAWLARQCAGRTPDEIAQAVIHLVRQETLAVGVRLPTLRALSGQLEVSQGTLAGAWGILRKQGFIETRRRGGSFVVSPPPPGAPRATSLPRSMDLSRGLPDPTLLPPLDTALLAGLEMANRERPDGEPMLPALAEFMRADWAFEAPDLVIGGGSSESLLLAVQSVTQPGQLIAVEQPTQPRLLAIARTLGLRTIAVACDEAGPVPEALAAALQQRPVAFVMQVTAQIPIGFTLGEARAAKLAAEIDPWPELKIVEDDWIGPIGAHAAVSLGRWHPERTVHVRSFCKAFGLELRCSMIGGSADAVAEIRRRKAEGLGTASRILQGALLHLLTDRDAIQAVKEARLAYARRRLALLDALRQQGVTAATPQDGLFVTMPVPEEAATVLGLAERGLSVVPGSRSYFSKPHTDAIRIAISRLPDDPFVIGALAGEISEAGFRFERSLME